jgi:acyl-CoA reductase-like NAD-dependent aldehyde dehydrogenase
MPLRIRRSIAVKAVVTEELLSQLGAELQSALAAIEAEIRRLDAAGADRDPAERAKRLLQKEQALAKLRELARLEIGSEVTQGTVEGEVEVRLGDDWARLFASEIVLRDGRVVALRE